MQDMGLVQDAGFVVEWQLADDAAGGERYRLIDLSAEGPRPEIVLPEDNALSTTSGG
ncbi:MAG: hypothetical protein QOF96_490 [Actinomycetota bacterium]|nr:hypothetical protein [Actinomycetota bacterium]